MLATNRTRGSANQLRHRDGGAGGISERDGAAVLVTGGDRGDVGDAEVGAVCWTVGVLVRRLR